jgi:ribosomal protein S18 acetylase RimI-like enzyme
LSGERQNARTAPQGRGLETLALLGGLTAARLSPPASGSPYGPRIPEGALPAPLTPHLSPVEAREANGSRSLEALGRPLGGLELRLLEPADVAPILALDAASHDHRWTLDNVLDALASPLSLSLGVFQGSSLLAMALGSLIQPEFHLLNLATRPDFRRLGIGRALMRAALALASVSGAPICHLETRADDPAPAGLYESLGFIRTGLRQRYYPDGTDAVLMTRTGSGGRPDGREGG